AAIERLTGDLHRLAKATARQASHVLASAERTLRRERRQDRRRRGAHLVRQLQAELALVQRLISQTAQGLAGELSIPGRMVSLSDPDARPIRGASRSSRTSSASR
ncbi:MAG TPA: hypothetical protein VF221_13555, partial [Chloroflexota bacterium]